MNFDFDPIQRKLVNGPEAGANVEVDGFTVSVIGGGTGTETLYNAGTGIGIEGSTITNTMAGAGRIAIDGGTTSFIPSADIVNVTGTSVTLQPDTAYKIYATSQAITLNANPPAAGKWAYEGHLEIFVSGTGYVVTGTNVVLANALEPDAVNNCTVRFHDGIAIIAVEDHVAGYIVVNGSTSGAGSLYYGLATSTNEYIAFDASLNGQTLDLAGATTYAGEKHVVGNGYAETILSGSIVCTSKTTFSNLSMDGVVFSGGTGTLGDVFIPSGSTVSVSGGGLAVEKVTGAGSESVIDLGNTSIPYGTNVYADGITFTGSTTAVRSDSPAAGTYTSAVFSGVTFSSCGSPSIDNGGAVFVNIRQSLYLNDCVFVDNQAQYGKAITGANGYVYLNNCTFAEEQSVDLYQNTSAFVSGTLKTLGKVSYRNGSPQLVISNGATIDLTGNTNTTVFWNGGRPTGFTFAPGGATVYPSAGSASAVTIGGGTFTAITNGGVLMGPMAFRNGETISGNATVDLNNTAVPSITNTSLTLVGLTLTNGYRDNAGAIKLNAGYLGLSSCVISGNTATAYAGGVFLNGGSATITSCTIKDNPAAAGGDVTISYGVNVSITNSEIGYLRFYGGASASGPAQITVSGTFKITSIKDYGAIGTVTISSGATLDLTGNTNATPIAPGGGISFASGGATVLYSSGAVSGSYMMDNVTLPAGAKLTNTAVVDLNGKCIPQTKDCIISGATISGGGNTNYGGGLNLWSNGTATLSNTTFTGNSANFLGNAVAVTSTNVLSATNCVFSGNTGVASRGAVGLIRSATAYFSGCSFDNEEIVTYTPGGENAVVYLSGDNTIYRIRKESASGGILVTISSGASINLTGYISSYITGGISVVGGTCTVNGNVIPAGAYTSIDSNGQPT